METLLGDGMLGVQGNDFAAIFILGVEEAECRLKKEREVDKFLKTVYEDAENAAVQPGIAPAGAVAATWKTMLTVASLYIGIDEVLDRLIVP
jgi:hypothetical protein